MHRAQAAPVPERLSYTSPRMTLTPDLVADILVRQKHITPEQGEMIKQEAKLLPSRMRTGSAYEQKSVAYEIIIRLNLRDLRGNWPPGVFSEDIDLAREIIQTCRERAKASSGRSLEPSSRELFITRASAQPPETLG